jgi:flagellar biosynthesis/type III secretory pathway protein FliH
MKPLSIADHLDRLGNAASENEPKRRESSPFRPRSVPSPQTAAPRSNPVFDRIPHIGGAGETQGEGASGRTPSAPKPIPIESAPQQSPGGEPVKTEDMSSKLAEAYARGREEGLAAGRAEASESHATELAAAREQAETQRQEFQLNEYAKLEDTIRSDLRQMEDTIGAAVTRTLVPFLSEQVVKRAVNELNKAIARLSAGRSAELMKIRGPERILALLRQRIVDLPINVEYVEDERVETVVEADSTLIVAELRPWAELLASFEA